MVDEGERGTRYGLILRQLLLEPHRVLAFGFAGAILFGTLLLSLPVAAVEGEEISFLDALFTATSAVCVTGLLVVNTATAWSPFGQAVILALIQIGGLGIMTLSVFIALVLGKRVGLRERLVIQEALGAQALAGMVRLTRTILLTTFAIESVGALLLALWWSRQFPPHEAVWLGIFHAVSAFNNAGFDLFGDSLVPFQRDWVVNLVVILLIVLGGLGFPVLTELRHWLASRRNPGAGPARLSLQTRIVLRFSAALIGGGTVLILAVEFSNPATLGPLPLATKVLVALFQAVTPRTAGFNSVPVDGLREVTLFLIILLMFIGASPAGTGGGVKTTTVGVVLASVWATIRGRQEVESFDRRLPRGIPERALALVAIAGGWVAAAAIALGVAEGGPFLPLLFEVTSAFGTVGLSTGITPDLSPVGKWVVIATMYMGRVGPLTLALALARLQRRQLPVRYPEERLMIG